MGRKIRKRLKRFADKQALVRITRSIRGTGDDDGFVLAVGPELVLLAVEDEFEFDGFLVLRIDDIKRVRRSAVDELHEKWMREATPHEEFLPPVPPVDLTDMASMLLGLQASGLMVIAEDERPGKEQFELGPIERVGRKSAWFRFLQPKATWWPHLGKLRHACITRVRFLGRYTSMYQQHAPPIPE